MPEPQVVNTQDWFTSNGIRGFAAPQEPAAAPSKKVDTNWFEANGIRGMDTPIGKGMEEANQPLLSQIMDFIKPMVRPVVAGGLAGMAATAAAPTGPLGSAAAGVGTYTAVDLALKNAMQGNLGSAHDELMDTGKNALINEGGGAALRAVGRGLQAIPTVGKFKESAGKLAEQITGRPRVDATDPYYLAASLKTDVENAAGAVQNPPAVFSKDGLRKMLQAAGEGSPLIERLKSINKDPDKIQDVLDAGGVRLPGIGRLMSGNPRADLAGFELTQLMQQGPKAALESLDDVNKQEAYKKLFSQQTRANLEQLFKAGKFAENVSGFADKGLPRAAITYGGLHIAASLFTGHLSPYGAMEAGFAGAVIGGTALAKIMSNTPLARGLTRLAEGTAAGMSDQTISRMLVGALQGQVISLIDANGGEIKGTVEREDDGAARFVPLPDQRSQQDQSPYQPTAAF